MQEFNYLGKRVTAPTDVLDIFPKPDLVTLVKFESDELTSFCPVTGQPDFSEVVIEYEPDKLCVESKSLKLYLWTFREKPIFGEGLASEITSHLYNTLSPYWCKVTLKQNIRGGLQLTAVAEKHREDPNEG